MEPRAVPEIREALALLEAYEASGARHEDARSFQHAFEILDDFVEDDPDTPHLQFINNIRYAHTRRMLQRLGSVDPSDLAASIEHVVVLVETVAKETERLLAEHPDLRKDYDRLMGAWKGPLGSSRG
jgi:hypothetical protein